MPKNFTLQIIPKHYQVAAAGWLNRFVASFCQIALISIALNYLGVELYAVFAIVLSLQCWFVLADCGIGSSIQNYISEARARNTNLKQILSNTVILLWSLFFIFAVIVLITAPFLQYILLRHLAPELAHSQYYLFSIVGIILIATAIFGVGYRVFFAQQRGYLVYLYQGIGYVIAIVDVLVIKHLNIVHYRLLALLVGWLLPILALAVVSFVQVFPINIRSALQHFDLRIIKALIVRGMKFWGLAITATFAVLSDYLVISQTLNAHDITVYNILAKSFSFIFFIYMAVLNGLWPELAELFAKKEWHKANGLLKRNILLGMFIIAICTLVFFVAKNLVVTLLAVKTSLVIASGPILLFGFYYLVRVWVDSYAVALQSQNFLKVSVIIATIQAMLSVSGMYFLSQHFGINGVICGLLGALILTSMWVLPLFYYKRKEHFMLK